MYAFNCPTFLFTQKHWKLFVENKERNSILTFPYDTDPEDTTLANASLMQPMGTTFLKAIVICLLSKRTLERKHPMATPGTEPAHALETPQKNKTKRRHFGSSEKQQRRKSRKRARSGFPESEAVPRFISGYADGEPIYSTVRVYSEKEVSEMEMNIAAKEQMEKMAQASQVTLVDQACF